MSLWQFFTVYLVASAAGYYIGKQNGIRTASVQVIDFLINNGYLRSQKTTDGEVLVLKINDTGDDL